MTIQADPQAVRTDAHGAVRVGDSQVLLDVFVEKYESGADAETIARDYPTLRLADVHAAIAYYLRHKQEVAEYLRVREEEAERLCQEVERKQGKQPDLRAELLARRAQQEQGHASPCG